MEFKELFELGYEYDRCALNKAIFQIDNYNNEPTSKKKKKELGYSKALASNRKESEIFEKCLEELLEELQEVMVLSLSYRINGVMTEVDGELKKEIYDCVLNEVNRIIRELN